MEVVMEKITHWLSYGAGVNSTALAILLHQGKVEGVSGWKPIFSDTGNEKDETYRFLEDWARPWFREIRNPLITVNPPETVLERWQRLKVIGTIKFRACTDNAKITPMRQYIKEFHGTARRRNIITATQLVGIDAGEAHRATRKEKNGLLQRYPLVELDIDREDCEEIIQEAGLPVPVKSGCWHCPFMRVAEVLELVRSRPDRMDLIEQLEIEAEKDKGNFLCQFKGKPVSQWKKRAYLEDSQMDAFIYEPEPPCGCFD